MANFTNNDRNFTMRKGLRCVWTLTNDNGRTALTMTWIAPSVAALELNLSLEVVGTSDVNEDVMAEEVGELAWCFELVAESEPLPAGAAL